MDGEVMGKGKKIIVMLTSVTTALWWLALLLAILVAGSTIMLRTGGFESINSAPLFRWMSQTSLTSSWWLYAAIVCLMVLVLNTVFCSVQSLLIKAPARSLMLKISPQVIHAGFLLIMVAHLFSSYDSFHADTVARENQGIRLTDRAVARISGIAVSTSRSGFPLAMKARVTVLEDGKEVLSEIISPNHPAFYRGLGIYLKNARGYPSPLVLIEVSYDRGAVWALAGGIVFFAGNILLVLMKWRGEQHAAVRKPSPGS